MIVYRQLLEVVCFFTIICNKVIASLIIMCYTVFVIIRNEVYLY